MHACGGVPGRHDALTAARLLLPAPIASMPRLPGPWPSPTCCQHDVPLLALAGEASAVRLEGRVGFPARVRPCPLHRSLRRLSVHRIPASWRSGWLAGVAGHCWVGRCTQPVLVAEVCDGMPNAKQWHLPAACAQQAGSPPALHAPLAGLGLGQGRLSGGGWAPACMVATAGHSAGATLWLHVQPLPLFDRHFSGLHLFGTLRSPPVASAVYFLDLIAGFCCGWVARWDTRAVVMCGKWRVRQGGAGRGREGKQGASC